VGVIARFDSDQPAILIGVTPSLVTLFTPSLRIAPAGAPLTVSYAADDLIDDEDEEAEAAIEAEDVDDDEPSARVEGRGEHGDHGDHGDGQPRSRRRRRRRGGRRDDGPAEQALSAPAPAADGDDEPGLEEVRDGVDAQGQKRRRRGRRGGRRTREETAGDEPYVWSRPRVPEGDPYIWMEAGQPQPTRTAEPVAATHAPEPADAAAPASISVVEPAPAATADSTDEMWVELPAVAEPAAKPARARRSRAKPKAAEDVVAVIEAEAAPALVEAEAEPAPIVVEAAPEPVRAAKPATAPAAPDHAEISSPPAAPKRGWWRRSG